MCKKIPVVKAPIHEYNSEDSLGKISEYLTANWKYDDLIGNHIPKEHKYFSNDWDKYINNVSIYQCRCDKLYNKIKEDLLENANLEYDPEVKRDNIITKYFVILIYTQHIYWIKYRKLFHQKDNICTINGTNLNNNLNGYLLARGDSLRQRTRFDVK
jgi:hypothetical protein